jgi:S1-C subfamily serine protease
MRILASILILLIASDAGGADCSACEGRRVTGEPPILFPCPACLGTGTVADPEPQATSAEPSPSPPAAAPVFAAAATVATCDAPRPSEPAVGRPRPVVARVTAGTGPSMDMGSGVLVSVSGTTGVVLTNWHVVRDKRHGVKVSWPDGTQDDARLLAWDDAWDLAALAVPRPKASPVQIAAQAPRKGDRLTIAGYGMEGRYLEQTGAVTEYLSPTPAHPKQFVECRATARHGDSGGPMFNQDGELAGVLFGEAKGLTAGSCSTRLRLFLAAVPSSPGSAPQLAAARCSCPGGRCAKP